MTSLSLPIHCDYITHRQLITLRTVFMCGWVATYDNDDNNIPPKPIHKSDTIVSLPF